MVDTLYILQWWIIQGKPKVMMVFLLHLYVYFYGFAYLFLNLDRLKSLKNKQKNRCSTLVLQSILNINLKTLLFIYRTSAQNFDRLNHFWT